jgi:hypothetical protein
MRTMMSLGAGLLAVALSACGTTEEDDRYLDAIPDAAALSLEIQGGADEGLALTVEPAAPAAAAPAAVAGTPETPDDLADGRAKIRALNEAVRAVFARVADVASTGGHELPGGVKVYGPADRCVEPGEADACLATANLRLVVRLHRGDLASFVLEARPVDSTLEADFHPVLAGYLIRGEAPRRGAGKLWVNLENLAAAAGAGFKGQGFLTAGFASGPVARAATFRMLDFTRDPAVHPPVTAAFSGFRSPTGTARVRVAAIDDFDRSGPDTELGLGRLVYNPSLGGRAFTIVRNWLDRQVDPAAPHGDVPADQYWFGRSCYAAGATTPAFKEWFLCPVGQGPVACLVAQGGTWVDAVGTQVAGDAGATWKDTCALPIEPPEFAPPPGPPSDDPSDDAPEEGQGQTGLVPEPVPGDCRAPDLTPPLP